MLYQAVRTADSGTELSENEIAEALYSYTDGAYVPDWAREGTAYFVRQGLTGGIGDNLLGIGEPISAEQASILTYRAAGSSTYRTRQQAARQAISAQLPCIPAHRR